MTMKQDYTGYVSAPQFSLERDQAIHVQVSVYKNNSRSFAAMEFFVGKTMLIRGFHENTPYAQAIAAFFEKLNAEHGDDHTGA